VKASGCEVELSRNHVTNQEAFVSHADATLTPITRPRLARAGRRWWLDLFSCGDDVHGLPAHGEEVPASLGLRYAESNNLPATAEDSFLVYLATRD